MAETYNFNPLLEKAPITATQPDNQMAANQGAATILVVEDLVGLRHHVISVLQQELKLPVKFVQADNGHSAIEAVIALKPDLVIMDIALPGMNGVEIAKTIWALQPKTKVLFWSNHCGEIHIRALALLAPHEANYGFIVKSSPDESLIYAVTSLLVHNHPYIDQSVRLAMARIVRTKEWLSDIELETLSDVTLGLTDKAIAIRRHISQRGVQSRISSLYKKLLFGSDEVTQKLPRTVELVNLRVRVVFEAFRRGWIVPDEMPRLNSDFHCWLVQTLGKPHSP